jgi:mono/diheme cytochrome c family protein
MEWIMRNVLFFVMVPALATAFVLGACTKTTTESESNLTPDSGDPVITDPLGDNPTGGGQDGGATDASKTQNVPAPATGLPCEIEFLLATHCLGCHSGAKGVPPLRTYDELLSKAANAPDKTRAQVALDQMKAGTMPPKPASVDPEDIAAFEKWVVTDKTPKNPKSCAEPEGDGGLGDAGKSDGGDGTTKCTSNKQWTGGNTANPNMNPGEACIFCHVNNPTRENQFYFAGTIYPTSHEPDDCYGKAPPPELTVTITDSRTNAGGQPRPQTFTMKANEAGNFFLPVRGNIRPVAPFSVSISDGTKTRVMPVKAPNGDCNACHTVQGSNGAPGRILAPN